MIAHRNADRIGRLIDYRGCRATHGISSCLDFTVRNRMRAWFGVKYVPNR